MPSILKQLLYLALTNYQIVPSLSLSQVQLNPRAACELSFADVHDRTDVTSNVIKSNAAIYVWSGHHAREMSSNEPDSFSCSRIYHISISHCVAILHVCLLFLHTSEAIRNLLPSSFIFDRHPANLAAANREWATAIDARNTQNIAKSDCFKKQTASVYNEPNAQ